MNRWYGGMVHELGHAFGLPDSSYTDGTPMSASFYNYPNTHFNEQQKSAIRNGRYGGFLFGAGSVLSVRCLCGYCFETPAAAAAAIFWTISGWPSGDFTVGFTE